MNNIGFAATQKTATTSNHNATQVIPGLNTLANSFSSSDGLATNDFNSIILSLFMQIIQALLKNMQNKPCCDATTKPQTLPLDQIDTNKLQSSLFGHTDSPNVTTISSIGDSNRDGKLSVGDKINLKTIEKDPKTGAETGVNYTSLTLTQEQLDRYQNKLGSLNLNADQVNRLFSGEIANANSIDLANLKLADNDYNAKISVGDTLSAPYNPNSSEEPVWEHQLTKDEANVINGEYGKTLGSYTSSYLTATDLPTNPPATANEALAKALNLDTRNGDYLRVVFDKDNNGKLSVGDIAVIDYYGATSAIGNKPPRFATGPYIELSADVVAAATKQEPSNHLSLSNAEKNKLFEIITLGRNYINTPSLVNVVDTDHNGALSIGDQMNFKAFSGREDELTGEPIFNHWTEALTAEQLSDYENLSKTPTK